MLFGAPAVFACGEGRGWVGRGAGMVTRVVLTVWGDPRSSARVDATRWMVATGRGAVLPVCEITELLVGDYIPTESVSSMYLLPPRDSTPWLVGYSISL